MSDKISKTQYSPGLFDITQDIIGGLPIKLIENWLDSQQTHGVAVELLRPYQVTGYSVSSDSAGLTRLTKQKGLLEILALINQPKEIVYGIGMAIGGEGVGIWAADNTQMFYPASISADTLVSALLTIEDEISKNCQISIGIGAHYGEFYYISGGLYGLEADTIEAVAENDTEGGEIVISQAICSRLPANNSFHLTRRSDLLTPIGDIFRVLDGNRLTEVPGINKNYPIPYSDSFYADLVEYENRLGDRKFCQALSDKYIVHKFVVLIERESKAAESHEIGMFTNLSISAMMKDIGMRLLPQSHGMEIKVISSLGIYTFDNANAALEFAQAFRAEFAKEDIACRIGIDGGATLVFDLSVGGKDIAGMPVNVASKMAQDKGEFGKLYLSYGMKEYVDVSRFREINYTVSGVEMTVYEG